MKRSLNPVSDTSCSGCSARKMYNIRFKKSYLLSISFFDASLIMFCIYIYLEKGEFSLFKIEGFI